MIVSLNVSAPKSVHIDGTPIVAATGCPLELADIRSISFEDSAAWMRLAKSLRGQFAIVVSQSSCAIAVTDLTGCYPVFRLAGANSDTSMIGNSLSELEPHSRRSLRRSALFQYIAFSAMDIDGETIYTDIARAPAASVTFYQPGRADSREYADWQSMVSAPSPVIAAAEDRLTSLIQCYTDANLSRAGASEPLGILLSGGTDSALLASLLRDSQKGRLRCFTQHFSFSRYSEFPQAKENAAALGMETEPVMLGRSAHFKAVLALNSADQDQPCATMQAFNLWSIVNSVSSRCRTFMLGEHADSLFLGFGHFFEGLPSDFSAYMTATCGMSTQTRLSFVAPRVRLDKLDEELLSVLSLPKQEYLDWLVQYRHSRTERLAPFASNHLTALQQLNGQIDGGLSWQRIVLPVTRSLRGVAILTPFFDSATIALALSLPVDLKYRDGKTKFLLRHLLHKYIGREMRKQPAAASPVAIWRLLPSLRERSALSASLRHHYDELARRNFMARGRLVNQLIKVAALGIWMRGRKL